MKQQKIILVTGYNEDQRHSIDIEEAHTAYYLFLNPQKRGIFKNGLALTGNQIIQIIPDYHAAMGWNRSYKIGPEDYREVDRLGIEYDLKSLMIKAREVSKFIDRKPELAEKPLSRCVEFLVLLKEKKTLELSFPQENKK